MSKQIEAKVTITGIEGWDVNWNDPEASHEELFKVRSELLDVVCRHMGIDSRHIKVDIELVNS